MRTPVKPFALSRGQTMHGLRLHSPRLSPVAKGTRNKQFLSTNIVQANYNAFAAPERLYSCLHSLIRTLLALNHAQSATAIQDAYNVAYRYPEYVRRCRLYAMGLC